MTELLAYALSGIAAYLLGAIPFGLIIGKSRGVDIRTIGSGNIGATNVFRCVGKGWGIFAFLLDMMKGYLAACGLPLLAAGFTGEARSMALAISCTILAVVGHNWPVFLRFRGGKGIATTTGGLLGLAPAAMGIGLLAWALTFMTTRYVSVASMGAALVAAAASWWLYAAEAPALSITLTILAAMAIWRHRPNIRRLAQGTENRFDFKRKQHH